MSEKTVSQTIALALRVTESRTHNIRRYELRSRLSGHTVAELLDTLTVAQVAAARHKLGGPPRKDDLIDLVIWHHAGIMV